QHHLKSPLFYNSAPQSAENSARRALELVKQGDPRGRDELAILGGAALPVILPELPSLNIHQQRDVARALAPVAKRMQLQEQPTIGVDSSDADAALLFWQRYRHDLALHLRPLTSTRLVKRTALSVSQVRNADRLAVATYAPSRLLGALGGINDQWDATRARSLVVVISPITEKPWIIEP